MRKKTPTARATAAWRIKPETHKKLRALSASRGSKMVLLAEVAAELVLSLSPAEFAARVEKIASK